MAKSTRENILNDIQTIRTMQIEHKARTGRYFQCVVGDKAAKAVPVEGVKYNDNIWTRFITNGDPDPSDTPVIDFIPESDDCLITICNGHDPENEIFMITFHKKLEDGTVATYFYRDGDEKLKESDKLFISN